MAERDQLGVRFAAMIPASCAVVRASPFGSSRSCRAVSGAMRTSAAATARRRESRLVADVHHADCARRVDVRETHPWL